jgi:lysophospholipase L1-like esterase
MRMRLLVFSIVAALCIACSSPSTINAWGDSLTQMEYPGYLSAILQRPVVNLGVGAQTSTQIVARMRRAVLLDRRVTSVLWIGNNNAWESAVVERDIREALRILAPMHFVILSEVVGDYPDRYKGTPKALAVDSLNAALRSRYPNNFLDIRGDLAGLATTHDDSVDAARGVIPRSLRKDRIHLTKNGYRFVAQDVARFLRAKGW